jgi:hypothetical protein
MKIGLRLPQVRILTCGTHVTFAFIVSTYCGKILGARKWYMNSSDNSFRYPEILFRTKELVILQPNRRIR